MHTGMAQRMAGSPSRPATGSRSLRRAAQYLTRYGRQALLPYAFLIIATLAQLAVPNMVRRILDAVTGGYLANQVLAVLDNPRGGGCCTTSDADRPWVSADADRRTTGSAP
jgi:ATP-binding cassette subfamily B protein